jgi:uncharacterized membrane protein YdjX (TVP38/TMEM64 family)
MLLSRILGDRRLWLGAALLALVLGLRLAGLDSLLSLDALARHREALSTFVARNLILAVAGYVLVYAGAVALSVPGAVVLTLAGGFLFGAVLGTLLTVIGATAGATVVFLLARAVFGDNALERFGPKAQGLARGIRRNAASYLLVLRLVPLFPFFLVNLVPAFAGVGLTVYVATTFIGILPGTAVFSLTGAGLGGILDAGATLDFRSVLRPEILAALFGLAALSLAAIPLRNRFARGAEGDA